MTSIEVIEEDLAWLEEEMAWGQKYGHMTFKEIKEKLEKLTKQLRTAEEALQTLKDHANIQGKHYTDAIDNALKEIRGNDA